MKDIDKEKRLAKKERRQRGDKEPPPSQPSRPDFIAPSNIESEPPSGNPSLDNPPASPKTGAATQQDVAQALGSINGDVFIQSGTYRGSFTLRGRGTVRPVRGHRVTFDGYAGGPSFKGKPTLLTLSPDITIDGSGGCIEVMNSYRGRQYRRGDQPNQLGDGPQGVRFNAPNCRLINCFIHDTLASGVLAYEEGPDCEIYGNIFYLIGVSKYDHGIYSHSYSKDVKRIVDNIFVNNVGTGITLHYAHAPAPPPGTAHLDGYLIEGNVLVNNGLLEEDYRNWTIGTGGNSARRITARNNYTFQSNDSGVDIQLMYSSDDDSVVFEDNVFCGGALEINDDSPARTKGNYLLRKSRVLQKRTKDWRPKKTGAGRKDFQDSNAMLIQQIKYVFIRPNQYQQGRANVVIYNLGGAVSVPVDIGTVLKPGQSFKVFHAADPLGAPVLAGVHNGLPLQLPMRGLPIAKPIDPIPGGVPDTSPTFATFLVVGE